MNAHRVVRVALIDDHFLLRQGMAAVLRGFADIEVVASVEGIYAFERHSGVRPDVVSLDLHLQDGPTGLAAVARISKQDFRVLVVTAEINPALLLAAMRAGALGFIGKSCDSETLRAAIRATAAGESLLTPAMAARLRAQESHASTVSFPPALAETLRMLALGLDNASIGRRRGVSVGTVKKQVRQIRDLYAEQGRNVPDRTSLRDAARGYLDARLSNGWPPA